MIRSDNHLHSDFSGDAHHSLKSMIDAGIKKGLTSICFTDHCDLDYPYIETDFSLDAAVYAAEVLKMQQLYQDKIDIRLGVEIGLQPHINDKYTEFMSQIPYDFIIGSTHVIEGWDPYYRTEKDLTVEAAIRSYLQEIIKNLNSYSEYHVIGHIDYVVRYVTSQGGAYQVSEYMNEIDEIISIALDKGLGIEINTSGLRRRGGNTHPHPEILKRYREKGGEIITVGSDAHKPEDIAFDFAEAGEILKQAGFRYYTQFRQGRPEFIPI